MKAHIVTLFALACLWPHVAAAASLRVSPTSLIFTAPAKTGILTLRNDGDRPVNVQVRPFAWTQKDGEDMLTPTRDVVVSPPITKLEPGVDYVVRVVRIVKRDIVGEEAYRILVDELPDPARRENNVTVLLRYSLPVFFRGNAASEADVRWQAERDASGFQLSGKNLGDRHLRVANLKARLAEGPILPLRDGLVGYVLGRSSVRWALPVRLPAQFEGEVNLIGESNEGSFDDSVAVGTAR